MNGFVHTAEGFAQQLRQLRHMFRQFHRSDTASARWGITIRDFSTTTTTWPLSSRCRIVGFRRCASKSIHNRIATFTGGTTQGLVTDPGGDDHLPQLAIPTIFHELDQANVSWKIYYTVTEGFCLNEDDCASSANDRYPATAFSNLTYSFNYLYGKSKHRLPAVPVPLQASSVVGDASNSFCIDPNHIAPLSQYYSDLTNGTLPSFAFIEAGYGNNDEHPGSGQSVLVGQAEVAKILNAFMASSAWNDSVFFFAYDEGGGPYDHVPPVPGHSNDNTDASLGTIPDISTIAVNRR